MKPHVSTHLMFQGDAADALDAYAAIFPDFIVETVERPADDEPAGVMRASVSFAGHRLIVIDSPPIHDFGFTPAISLFVDLDDAAVLNAAFARLSEGGEVMMPLGDYGFSRRFGWVSDRFGVSWQLNLPNI